jgi:hypothetical protein
MSTFFISLPAILGVLAFVIYYILRKSITEDPIIKSILDKVRRELPEIYQSIESLDNKQKEELLKKDISIRKTLSLNELKLLDTALKHQFRTNLYVYSLCGILLLSGIGLFIYYSNKPKQLVIDNIQIQNTDSTSRNILVDLDPVTVTWTSTGHDEIVFVALENVESGQQSKKVRVQASEAKIIFKSDRYDNYDKILSNRQPLQSNRVRAIVFTGKESFQSKEFEIKVGVRLLCLGTLPNRIEFLATIDNRIVDNYSYLPTLALFKKGSNFQNPIILEGNELAPKHEFKISHPETIDVKNFILSYKNSQDDRLVRTEVDLGEFLKLKKKV